MKAIKFIGRKTLPLLLVMGVLALGGCGGGGEDTSAGSATGSAQ